MIQILVVIYPNNEGRILDIEKLIWNYIYFLDLLIDIYGPDV